MEYVPAKTIVTKTRDSGWFGVDYNMNLYRGCCHGCIYCDSRSSCYRIKDFDRVRAKEDALRIVRDDLRRKARTGVVGTGAMSDPYNPFERELELTRHALELIAAYGFGAAVATKSTLLCRDIDVLQDIREQAPVILKVTITTADDGLSALIEPGAPRSSERFAMLERLSKAGLFCGILLMPVLPFLEDTEENVREMVRRAAAAGARFIYPAFGMTMRDGQREWYLDRLEELFPGRGLAQRYIRQYGNRYRCTSPHVKELWPCFAEECRRAGILYEMGDIIPAYRRGYDSAQLGLFD